MVIYIFNRFKFVSHVNKLRVEEVVIIVLVFKSFSLKSVFNLFRLCGEEKKLEGDFNHTINKNLNSCFNF